MRFSNVSVKVLGILSGSESIALVRWWWGAESAIDVIIVIDVIEV